MHEFEPSVPRAYIDTSRWANFATSTLANAGENLAPTTVFSQRDNETGPTPRRVFDPGASAVGFRNVIDQRETNATAPNSLIARAAASNESLKHATFFISGNSRPPICLSDFYVGSLNTQLHVLSFAVGGVFYGVVHQVDHGNFNGSLVKL